MKIEITEKFPTGPIGSHEIELTQIREVSVEEYMCLLNNPDIIINIKVIEQ